MRKLAVIDRISLDGYFASEDEASAGMGWFIHDPEVDAAVHEPVESDTLLLGRRTFDIFEGFWAPLLLDPDAPRGMKATAEELTRMRKIVFSTSPRSSGWANTEFVGGDLCAYARSLKAGTGSDILILGSGSLVRQLSAAGLVDEYQLIVSPVALGGGVPLFGPMDRLDLELAGARGFESGNVVLRYRRAGRAGA